MASHGPLKKPPMSAMAILLFLADHPELLYVLSAHGGGIGVSSKHFATENGARYRDANLWKSNYRSHIDDDDDDEDEEKPDWYHNELAPEIPNNLADHRWYQSDWLVQVSKVCKLDDKGNEDNHWAWYHHPARMTDEGRAMALKHRAEYEKHRDAKLKKQKESERLIVGKNNQGYGNRRKYGFLARVVRETKNRLYVERVFPEGEKRARFEYIQSLRGRKGHEYVDRDDVVAENVTEIEYLTMRRVETLNLAWLDEVEAQEEAELDTIRERYAARREQNVHAFDDELREALEQVKK